ncbi:MAG: hypothetical protein DRN81_01960 [Thermoproteota archaeon]|nr:MAG: hypothetical protein DRN81_01960 [Candidatus Korarchaeota archaeon]
MIVERKGKLDFPLDKGLTYRGVIYIPSTTDRNKKIPANEFNRRINKISRNISETFGGNTVQRMGFGNWIGPGDKLVKERIARIEFFADKDSYLDNDSALGQLVHKLAKQWGQDAISFEFQTGKDPNTLHFVPSKREEFLPMIYNSKRRLRRTI